MIRRGENGRHHDIVWCPHAFGRRLSTTTTREGTDGTHRDGTHAGDGEDGRIDRADVISSIGTAAREDAGGGRASIVDFDFDFDFDY